MHVNILNQWPNTGESLLDVLKQLVGDPRLSLRRGRILAAYASEEGVKEIQSILSSLKSRKGTVSAIVGFDPRQTNSRAIRELIRRFPKGGLTVMGASNCAFHPKVYILDGERHVVAVIGSHNLTIGGLLQNWEASVIIVAERDDDEAVVKQIEQLWRSYESYRGANRQKLDKQWASRCQALLRAIDAVQRKARKETPLNPFGPVRTLRRRRKVLRELLPGRGSEVPTAILPRTMTMQILRETGPEGTQVQIPVVALEGFFGIDRGTSAAVTIRLNADDYRATILHFPNNTHRIQMSFLRGLQRPLLLILQRVPRNRDLYSAGIVASGSAEYGKLLSRCDRQTRRGSKRYGILPEALRLADSGFKATGPVLF